MARNRPSSSSDGFDPQAPMALVGGLAICSALAWLSGQLAALLFSRELLPLGFAEAPLVVFGWFRQWRNPALAFPTGARGLLPGPVGMYLCLGLVAAAPLSLVYGIRLRWRRPRSKRSAASTAWASRWNVRRLAVRRAAGALADLRAACAGWLAARSDTSILTQPAIAALVVPAVAAATTMRFLGTASNTIGLTKGSPRSRVLIGRRWRGLRRPLLAAESCASVICFGPPGSFKTGGLAIPAILEWTGPIVVPAIKPDVIHATLDWRSRPGRQVWIYNPLAAGGLASNTWTPLASCRSWAGAKEMGSWLAQAADLTGQSRDDVNYWTTLGGKLLAVLLYAAAGSGRTMSDVVRWVDTQEEHEVETALADLACSAAQDAWDACKGREQRTKSSVYGTAETLLDVFADPRVQHSASGCEIDLDLLLSGDHTLYLYAPPAQQRRLRPLFIALITAVVRRAQEIAATQPGGLLNPRLLLCLDEAGNIASIPDLPELATTGRGQGIALLSIFHDYGQVQARYGRHADTVVNAHRAKLILSGQADLATLRLAAELIGEEHTTEASVSLRSPFPLDDDSARTVARNYRPLLPADQIRQLPMRQGVLVYGNLPPTKVRLRAWWRTPGLRRRGDTAGALQ